MEAGRRRELLMHGMKNGIYAYKHCEAIREQINKAIQALEIGDFNSAKSYLNSSMHNIVYARQFLRMVNEPNQKGLVVQKSYPEIIRELEYKLSTFEPQE
jgi:hypothetical protein